MTMADKKKVSYDLLKKYGAKWAVLAALELDLRKKGVTVPTETSKAIEMSQVKISSGCFSTCEAHCDLAKIEGALIGLGAGYGEEYMDQWIDLLGQAMAGELIHDKILRIPLLKPIESKCGFLECGCS